MNANTVYGNAAYALQAHYIGDNVSHYTVHARLPFNEIDEAIGEGATPLEAAADADRELFIQAVALQERTEGAYAGGPDEERV